MVSRQNPFDGSSTIGDLEKSLCSRCLSFTPVSRKFESLVWTDEDYPSDRRMAPGEDASSRSGRVCVGQKNRGGLRCIGFFHQVCKDFSRTKEVPFWDVLPY